MELQTSKHHNFSTKYDRNKIEKTCLPKTSIDSLIEEVIENENAYLKIIYSIFIC